MQPKKLTEGNGEQGTGVVNGMIMRTDVNNSTVSRPEPPHLAGDTSIHRRHRRAAGKPAG